MVVISGMSAFYGSMGLCEGIITFGLVAEAMLCAWWVANGHWRRLFFAKIPMSEGGLAGREVGLAVGCDVR